MLSADKFAPPEALTPENYTLAQIHQANDMLAAALGTTNIVSNGSGHNMMLYQPKFVADNIIDIVDQVRAGTSAAYSSPSSCRSVMYLTMTSGVTCGMSLSGPIFASCTAERNRSVGAIDPRIGVSGRW